jgi:outer membrane protein OmpA-like peptidoglycan-associated protein
MKLKLALILAALLVVPGAAFAGDGVHAPTGTGETGLFTLFTGQTLPQGQWSFSFQFNNWDRTVIRDGGAGLGSQFSNKWDYDWNRLSASVGYGITDTFELSLMLPYENFDGSGNNRYGRINGRNYVNKIDSDGVGNLRLGAKWRVWEEGDNRFALNAFIEAGGDDDEGVVTGDTGFGLGTAYELGNWAFNLGYRDPGDPDNGLKVSTELLAGIGYAATVNDHFDWITELAATVYLDSDVAQDDVYDLISGGRLWFGENENWAFDFAARVNLDQLSDTDEFCPIGGLVGISFFPRFAREKALAAVVEPPPPPPVVAPIAPPPAPEPKPEPKVEPVPPPPPPPPVIEEECLFALNSTRVDNRCKATLDEVALRMKEESERSALVIGYTDSTGSEASNLRTSERRAEAVKNYLVTRHAIDPSRITVEGRGEADPAGDNSTREGRTQNRRARIILRVQ